jgi:hypothetical protein
MNVFTVPREIATLVSVPELLRNLGFEVNERARRARCLLHSGSNPTAFAWREDGRWHCFVCGKGGDRNVASVTRSRISRSSPVLSFARGVFRGARLNTDSNGGSVLNAQHGASRMRSGGFVATTRMRCTAQIGSNHGLEKSFSGPAQRTHEIPRGTDWRDSRPLALSFSRPGTFYATQHPMPSRASLWQSRPNDGPQFSKGMHAFP